MKFPIRLGKFNSTRILAGASGLLLALTLVAAFIAPVSAVPSLPHQFYGTVSIDSVPAPEGTEVVARIANATQNFTTIVDANHTYGYDPIFYVGADDPDTAEKEGGADGDTIEFYVANTWATNFTFKSGAHSELNLTVPGCNLTVNVTPVGGGNVTVNGVTPPSYPNTTTWLCGKNVTLNAAAAIGYIFVNWSGNLSGNTTSVNVTMDSDKNVTANFAEVTGATLEGHVSFLRKEAAGDSTWETPLVVRFFDNATKAEMSWSPKNVTTDAYGNFTISGIDPGIYDIGIKNWTCLSEVVTGVTLTAGNTTVVDFGTTREGDANNDDYVTMADLSLLLPAWNKHADDPEYSVNYDFNRDGYVTMADLSLMLPNWNEHGDLIS